MLLFAYALIPPKIFTGRKIYPWIHNCSFHYKLKSHPHRNAVLRDRKHPGKTQKRNWIFATEEKNQIKCSPPNAIIYLYLASLTNREPQYLFPSSIFPLTTPTVWGRLQRENIWLVLGHPISFHGKMRIYIWGMETWEILGRIQPTVWHPTM